MSNSSLTKIAAWDKKSASHLLSRTLYGYTKDDLEYALSLTLDEYVDNHLLADKPENTTPGFWINDTDSYNNSVRSRELTYWWYNLMLTQKHSLREKMVLFWHNHFVSELSKVGLPQRMYWQNKLFRDYAFGNFKELTKKIAIDPAMLIYLDGRINHKEDPNENFARELLELFTIGIGNYTEQDIVEGAKALTGWRVNGLESYFTESRFDDSTKNFMGQTGNFNYEDIINIIFTKEETSKFICRKLYKEFVYFEPDEAIVSELASILRSSNYELKPVLSRLLKSSLFHNEQIIGAKIKSPVEFIITAAKQFNVKNPDYEDLRRTANDAGQTLFAPPNVAGWEGDKTWITTNTLPERNIFTDNIIEDRVNVLEFARSFPSSENALQFVDDITDLFLSYKISDKRKKFLLDTLLDGAEVYDWSTNNENAEARLQSFFKKLCRLSEYQLC